MCEVGGGYHLAPSKERNLIKEHVNKLFMKVYGNLDDCNAIYTSILEKNKTQIKNK